MRLYRLPQLTIIKVVINIIFFLKECFTPDIQQTLTELNEVVNTFGLTDKTVIWKINRTKKTYLKKKVFEN